MLFQLFRKFQRSSDCSIIILLFTISGVMGLFSGLIIAIAVFFLAAQSLLESLVNPLLSKVVGLTYVDAWQLRKEFSLPAFLINVAMIEFQCKLLN